MLWKNTAVSWRSSPACSLHTPFRVGLGYLGNSQILRPSTGREASTGKKNLRETSHLSGAPATNDSEEVPVAPPPPNWASNLWSTATSPTDREWDGALTPQREFQQEHFLLSKHCTMGKQCHKSRWIWFQIQDFPTPFQSDLSSPLAVNKRNSTLEIHGDKNIISILPANSPFLKKWTEFESCRLAPSKKIRQRTLCAYGTFQLVTEKSLVCVIFYLLLHWVRSPKPPNSSWPLQRQAWGRPSEVCANPLLGGRLEGATVVKGTQGREGVAMRPRWSAFATKLHGRN